MKKFYLSLLLFCCLFRLTAQSPGGVSANLSLWIKADATSTLSTTGSTVNSWTYANNGSNVFTTAIGAQPTVASSTLNFLPSVAFNGTQYMTGPSGPGTPGAPIPAGSLAYSVFAVWSSTGVLFGSNQRVWNQRPNSNAFDNNFDGAAMWVYQGQFYGDQPEIYPFTQGATLNYTVNTPYISEMTLLNQNTNDLVMTDQTDLSTGGVISSTDPNNLATTDRVLSDGANLLGVRSISALDEPFTGNLSELIIYTAPVSGVQRNQIFSYLSMKYGIPTNTSLVSSTGATVWDATANAAYNNFVFGLGLDNTSGLSNTQSNSSATGTGNGTGIPGAGNIVLSSPSALANQSFLIVGSNNAGFAETATNLPLAAPPGSQRLTAQWMTQYTGTVGTTSLSFDFTGITTTGAIGTPSDFRLAVDQDGDGDFTTGSVEIYEPTSFTGNVANFTNVDFSAGAKEIFTILSFGPGTPLPVTWVNFTAQASGNDVDLSWTVGANQNAKVYEVQHSTDGVNFATIGQVDNIANVQTYSFVHSNAGPGTHYYRVLEVDIDGNSIYSKVVSAIINGSDFSIRLLNNPVIGNTDAQVEINSAKAGTATIELWTVTGARISTTEQFTNTGSNLIRIPLSGMPSVSYVMKVTVNGVTHVTQVVKL